MKYFSYTLVFALGTFLISCSEDDKLTGEIQNTIERGAVLRTVTNDPNSFIFDDASSLWTIELEEQDLDDGALLASVDVYVDFVDATPEDGTVTTTETMLETIPASEFESGVNGLPRTIYSLSYGDALTALGLTIDPSFASDQINIRLRLNLTDGRSFTNTDFSGQVSGGSFFSSPLNYRANIVCPPKSTNDPGTWTIEMQDSFGDGWNNASLEISIDGEITSFDVSEAEATVSSETLDIASDSEVLSIIFRSGDFDSEVTFQVFSASGTEILNLGPSPTPDVELLDYCTEF